LQVRALPGAKEIRSQQIDIERALAIAGMAGTALFYAKWKGAEKEAKCEKDEDDE
jgi:hypothetical protein